MFSPVHIGGVLMRSVRSGVCGCVIADSLVVNVCQGDLIDNSGTSETLLLTEMLELCLLLRIEEVIREGEVKVDLETIQYLSQEPNTVTVRGGCVVRTTNAMQVPIISHRFVSHLLFEACTIPIEIMVFNRGETVAL